MLLIENNYTLFTVLYKKWDEFAVSVAAWLGIVLVVLTIFSLDLVIRSCLAFIISFRSKKKFL